MLCKDLMKGMLLEIDDDQMCGWFNIYTRPLQKINFPEIPVRFRIAPDTAGLLVMATGVAKLYRSRDTIMYLGRQRIDSAVGKKSRQVQMVYVDGKTGYVKGCDIRFLKPVERDTRVTK
jgi:hypothetical protein